MAKPRRPELDALDLAILEHYQHNTQLPAHSIGKAVGLSAAAVQRRLKQLRENGVIVREAAQLEPSLLGLTNATAMALSHWLRAKLARRANELRGADMDCIERLAGQTVAQASADDDPS